MAFLVSPGVEVKEIDLTGIIPAVSTSIGGYAGHFDWGPIGDLVNISDEAGLAANFGAPSIANAESFFTAATFLRYGNTLLVSRAIDESAAKNAASGDEDGIGTRFLIRNINQYSNEFAANTLLANFYARCPGAYGNSLKIMVQPAGTPTRFNIEQLQVVTSGTGKAIEIVVTDPDGLLANGTPVALRSIRSRQDWINDLENSSVDFYLGAQDIDAYGVTTYKLMTSIDEFGVGTEYDPDSVYPAGWVGTVTPVDSEPGALVLTLGLNRGFLFAAPEAENFETVFANAPGTSQYAAEHGIENDEINLLIVDANGAFSDLSGSILERWSNLSVIPGAKSEDGKTIYYKDVINAGSKYIIADNVTGIVDGGDTPASSDPVITSSISSGTGSIWIAQLTGGANGTATDGNVYDALELLSDAESVDVNLLFAENDSEASITVANRLIRIVEGRKDCVAFISPDLEVADQSTDDAKLDKVLSKFERLPSSNYAIFDSTPIYVYDKYHDTYIWLPASGVMAGLCAHTDDVRDPWWSPAGYNRGQLIGVSKIAYNPLQSHRDALYKSRVNPIVSFPGEGIILYGDKTAQAKPSAFDRINVRRLFIVIEKAISTAAKYSLFEFNDEFTRAQFVNMIVPYLRDVQGRRGITDFTVVCDKTNNTGEVIDSSRFVADIYIKPARSINFITLNFVATRTSVEFSEVIGKF